MVSLSAIGHFIVSEWIWSVTWGIYLIPCNILVMISLLKFFLRINIVSAVFLSLGAHLFSFAGFTILTLFMMLLIGHGGGPTFFASIPKPLHAFVFLGLIYASLQSLFFDLMSNRHSVRLSWLITIAFISNNLTVLLACLFVAVE